MSSAYRLLLALGWLVAVFVYWTGPAPRQAPGPTHVRPPGVDRASLRVPTPEPAATEPQCPQSEASFQGLEKLAQIAAEDRFEEEIRDLQTKLERARAQGERYRRELAQAWQLYQSSCLAPPPAPSAPRKPRTRSRLKPRVRTSTPRVQLLGSDAFVSGQVRNSGDAAVQVNLRLELLLNRRVYRHVTLYLSVPPGSTLPYTHTFPTSLADGTYAARAEVKAW